MTAGLPLAFASSKRTGLDPGLYRVTHAQFPPKYLRVLPTKRNEFMQVNRPTANIAVQGPDSIEEFCLETRLGPN